MVESTCAARCATNIRREVKENFPTTKFSIRSQIYANGSSVHVRWIDGPTEERVDKVVKKYQYGEFDGIQDLYEHSNVRNDIPQVKYVSVNRTMSKEVKIQIMQELGIEKDDWKTDNDIYRKFRIMDLEEKRDRSMEG